MPAPPPRRPLRRSAPYAWRELTGAELQWAHFAMQRCGLVRGRGRPAFFDHVQRLEACLEVCARGLPWREAVTEAAPAMKPDTLRRCFRRWTEAGLWKEMLRLMAFMGAPSPAMEWFVCMAYRRAWRAQGLGGIVLARRCGFASALRAPAGWLPDPDLSAYWHREVIRPLAKPLHRMSDTMIRCLRSMLHVGKRLYGGVQRIPSWAKAGW